MHLGDQRPSRNAHVLKNNEVHSASGVVGRHLDRSKHFFRYILEVKIALDEVPLLAPLKGHLRLEKDARRWPGFRDPDQRGLLTRFRTELRPDFLNSLKSRLACGLRPYQIGQKTERAGDYIHQSFLGVFLVKVEMGSPDGEPHLISQDQKMTEFMPLRVVGAEALLSSTVDDGHKRQLPALFVGPPKGHTENLR